MKKLILLIFFIFFINIVFAEDNINVYFFYGKGCPHCAAAEPFLKDLEAKYPITIKSYETWYNQTNSELFISMSDACGSKVVGVPTIFIGHTPIIGFDNAESKGKEIEAEIKKCLQTKCTDLMDNLGQNLSSCPSNEEANLIKLPVFGEIDASKFSLPLLTVIIGLLDGFNPCAMWVLMFLLALLVYTRSRKKMFIVGGTFILVSGIVYYIFMAAWLNFFIFIGYLPYLRIIVGSLAILMGLINIKELFFFKKGISLTIPESAKPKIYERTRKIINEASLPLALIGVSVLAFTVNTIELLCTAGFPAIYTKILTMNSLSLFSYYAYLFLYIVMYMVDDMIVFTIAILTLSSKKMTEKQGKWMKFIAGFMMLALGLILIIKPNLLMFG